MTNPSVLAQEFFAHGRAAECPVIDMHTHPGPYSAIYFPNATPERMIETMDRSGVRLMCAVSHAALVETARGNAYTEAIVRKYPDRVRAYWGLNPNYPERVRAEVADFENHAGFVGFKFLADYHRVPITDEAYVPALEYAHERKLLILIHTWGRSAYDSPDHVEPLAKRYPGATLLMAHCGYGEWDKSIRLAVEYPNVYLEITGTHNPRGIIEKMVRGAGSEKVLYGTDLPWFDPHYVIGCVLCARITDEDRHNILHRNAERLLQPFGV
ncbi:MAG TPA: TatD family hydrolase [Armatimonadota bacterium]|jgi:predicted TIM-barrel fold metal-dependent hydrolase|nr:amidohydrolase family protein [Armatimonadota bacterium]HOJ22929.1 TatD family hydrolase [Armatimonadota bacterium]HOM83881.1 TatD family hydrolase [Armatimonadota bacterium]HPO74830.1 TatD family hydrolase [Armatimonadota bacterium]